LTCGQEFVTAESFGGSWIAPRWSTPTLAWEEIVMSAQFVVSLSRLHPSKRNPRRVKPAQVAHHTLVALIKAHGLLQPLVVRSVDQKSKDYLVIAGHRRLAALKEIHKSNGDPKIACVLKDVDDATADAISLGENFSQAPMHPLDEAEAFAKLASQDGRDAESIAAEFGVTDRYVRQRMKLSTLAKPIKEAYRADAIDTAAAEAFASVPEEKQLAVWKDVNGQPQNAHHVRRIIANDYIDLSVGIFDRSVLPENAITQDLFSEQVLVERSAFLKAQADAMTEHRQRLLDGGWSEVVCGQRGNVQDRLYAMDPIEKEFDVKTEKKLNQLTERMEKMEKAARKVSDPSKLERLQVRFEEIEQQFAEVEEAAEPLYSDNTKSRSTVFLLLDPDGRVHQEYRRPRRKSAESYGHADQGTSGNGASQQPEPPLTCNDLSDGQRARVYAHEVMVVRAALLKDEQRRMALLAVILHERLNGSTVAVRHDPNPTTLHAAKGEAFKSKSYAALSSLRVKCDPLVASKQIDTVSAFTIFYQMKKNDLMQLIALLTVELLFNSPNHPSPFVMMLARDLKVSIRSDWTPDANWLGSYQKIQLTHLVTELLGAVHAPAADTKKSTLVENLSKLFTDAAEGTLADKSLAEKVNRWLPSPFMQQADETKSA